MNLTKEERANIACYKVMIRASEKHIIVSKPVVESGCRYDLIFDESGVMKRVQVRWSDVSSSNCSGSLYVHLSTFSGGKVLKKGFTSEEIDCIIVYLPRVDKLVRLEKDLFENKQTITLRYEKPKNNQHSKSHFINDLLF